MRGVVLIAPASVLPVPADGSMLDPVAGRFWASWQDDQAEGLVEDAELDGAEAAIAWGRERSETVLIRLGNRGDTYFSAGTAVAEDDDGPMAVWPPPGPPPGGWWLPPVAPTLAEVEAVAHEVEEGKRSAKNAAAWAFTRIFAAADSDDAIFAALAQLTSGWIQVGDNLIRTDS